jgi:hypothetical protein
MDQSLFLQSSTRISHSDGQHFKLLTLAALVSFIMQPAWTQAKPDKSESKYLLFNSEACVQALSAQAAASLSKKRFQFVSPAERAEGQFLNQLRPSL